MRMLESYRLRVPTEAMAEGMEPEDYAKRIEVYADAHCWTIRWLEPSTWELETTQCSAEQMKQTITVI